MQKSRRIVPQKKGFSATTILAGAGVFVGGALSYLIWSEEEGRRNRRAGIMKDILREEKRVAECKECDSRAAALRVCITFQGGCSFHFKETKSKHPNRMMDSLKNTNNFTKKKQKNKINKLSSEGAESQKF